MTASQSPDSQSWFGAFYATAVLLSSLAHDGLYLADAERIRTSAATDVDLLVVGTALLTLLAPRLRLLVPTLAFLYVARAWFLLPNLTNHRILLLLVSLLVLASRGFGRPLRTFAVPALSVVYFFAGLAKLNATFLFSNASCARVFFERARLLVPFVPSSVGGGVAVATLLIEMSFVALLLHSRTRLFALRGALAFHATLALDVPNHLVDFSSTMLLLVSVARIDQVPRLDAVFSRARYGHVLGAAFLFHALTGIVIGREGSPLLTLLHQASSLIAFSSMAFAVARLLGPFARGAESTLPRLERPTTFAAILLGSMLLNGICPYLGLKTRSSFQMYSNLDLGPRDSNHYLAARSLDLLGYLSDSVRLAGGTARLDPRGAIQYGDRIPEIELERLVLDFPDQRFEIMRDDAIATTTIGRDDLPLKHGAVARKFLSFQPLGREARGRCIW